VLGCCESGNETTVSTICAGVGEPYWAAEEILASQEGLCFMDLIYLSVKVLHSNLL
jgi:hypothetical protein